MQPRILIAGIGNIFLGDDGFGCEVVRRLVLRSHPENLHIQDYATRSLDLAFTLLNPYDLVILVDAVNRQAAPGSLHLIEAEIEDGCTAAEGHGMDPGKVLALARNIGAPLKRVLIVGCQPAALVPVESDDGLTASVSAAVPAAIEMIDAVVMEACTNYPSL